MRRILVFAAFGLLTACGPPAAPPAAPPIAPPAAPSVAPPDWGSRLVLAVEGTPAPLTETMDVLRKRIASAGHDDALVEPRGADRIEVRIPGDADATALGRTLTIPGRLSFNLVDAAAVLDDYPVGEKLGGRVALPDDSAGGMPVVIFTDPIVTNADVLDARSTFDTSFGQPVIEFELAPGAETRFGRATSENVNRQFAIVFDDRILSAPHIRSPILGGSGQINGGFTEKEAQQMAIVLRTGALPARVTVLEVATYGAR